MISDKELAVGMNQLKALGFYDDLDFQNLYEGCFYLDSVLSRMLVIHDVMDHLMWWGFDQQGYIPTTAYGECQALVNAEARDTRDNRTPLTLEEYLEKDTEFSGQRVTFNVPYEWYIKCYLYWHK